MSSQPKQTIADCRTVALPCKPLEQGRPLALQDALRFASSEQPVTFDYVALDGSDVTQDFPFDLDQLQCINPAQLSLRPLDAGESG